MLAPSSPSLARTLTIAVAGLLLPFPWPGVLPHLFDTAQFTLDRHDTRWPTALTVLHVSSDVVIGVAYTVISSLLAYVVYQNRRALPFDWVVLSFGLFIVACGLTHFMHVVVRYQPVYWLDAYVRALTAIVSIATAAALPPLVPRIRQILGAEQLVIAQQRELERTNVALREAVNRAEVLAVLGDALQATTTVQDAANAAMQRLAPALNASSMLVVPIDGPTIRASIVWGNPPDTTFPLTAPPNPAPALADVPVIERVVLSGSAVYVDDSGVQPHAAGDLKGLSLGVEPILGVDGKVAGCVAVWRDSRHGTWTEGQRDLIRRAAATVGLALERARVTEEVLRQRDALHEVNLKLEHSNAELESFARVASHDLQEPLRTIASFSEVVNRKYGHLLDDNGRKYLSFMASGAERMKVLIQDLLAYSRLNAVHEPPRPVALEEPYQDALLRLQGALEDSSARVTSDPLPVVVGNAGELTQVFQNLLGNALKFGRPGVTPEVHVSTRRNGPAWQVTVRDNGTGIEGQYAERIFEMFQRLHSRDQYEGTGLGLAIVRKIVERHGGRIWVESEVGQGTAFHFTLHGPPEQTAPSS